MRRKTCRCDLDALQHLTHAQRAERALQDLYEAVSSLARPCELAARKQCQHDLDRVELRDAGHRMPIELVRQDAHDLRAVPRPIECVLLLVTRADAGIARSSTGAAHAH